MYEPFGGEAVRLKFVRTFPRPNCSENEVSGKATILQQTLHDVWLLHLWNIFDGIAVPVELNI